MKKVKLEFFRVILKHGLDSRFDGCVWMMREYSKLGGELRESVLPDFLDEESKEFIMVKFKYFNKMMEMYDKIKFKIEFYKILTGKESTKDHIAEEIMRLKRKEEINPMWEVISETNSIALKGNFKNAERRFDRSLNSGIQREASDQISEYQEKSRENSALAQNNRNYAFLTNVQDENSRIRNSKLVEGVPDIREDPMFVDDVSFKENERGFDGGTEELTFKEPASQQVYERENSHLNLQKQVSIRRVPHNHIQRERFRNIDSAMSNSMLPQVLSSAKFSKASGISANRSVVSAAFTAMAQKKMNQFIQSGVVYIGDARYEFPYASKFKRVDQIVPATAHIGNALVSEVIQKSQKRTLNTAVGSNSSRKSALVSETTEKNQEALFLEEHKHTSEGYLNTFDGLLTHVQFFEDDVLINESKNRIELATTLDSIESSKAS